MIHLTYTAAEEGHFLHTTLYTAILELFDRFNFMKIECTFSAITAAILSIVLHQKGRNIS